MTPVRPCSTLRLESALPYTRLGTRPSRFHEQSAAPAVRVASSSRRVRASCSRNGEREDDGDHRRKFGALCRDSGCTRDTKVIRLIRIGERNGYDSHPAIQLALAHLFLQCRPFLHSKRNQLENHPPDPMVKLAVVLGYSVFGLLVTLVR